MSSLRRSGVAPISIRTSPQRGDRLYLDQQRLDTSTPPGKAMVQVVGIFAEFELALIAER
jgi:DNA invertase Pin-like site-specific DNA recombinase